MTLPWKINRMIFTTKCLKSISAVVVFLGIQVCGQTIPPDVELLSYNGQGSTLLKPQNNVGRPISPPQGLGFPGQNAPYRQFDILPHVSLISICHTLESLHLSISIDSLKLVGEYPHSLLGPILMHQSVEQSPLNLGMVEMCWSTLVLQDFLLVVTQHISTHSEI